MEEWRRSKMCPDYEVNNYGTVKNIRTGKTVYPTPKGSGLYVNLRVGGKSKSYKLCEVVADAFCDDNFDHSDMKVIHKNKNRQDNAPGNLEYIPKRHSKRNSVSYNNTKIRCHETLETYHNLYECEAELGTKVRELAKCIRDGSLTIETMDGDVYHFEVVED